MIFYFSGTGNSKHIADKIASSTGDKLVSISESIIENNDTYEIGENESIGFVFPVYWYCVPTIVEKFIVQLKLSGYQKQYVYAIATYGIAAGNVMARLTQTLNKKQVQLNGIFGVKMVDNYVVGYNIIDVDKQRTILKNADIEIDKIMLMIKYRENIEYIKRGMIAFVTQSLDMLIEKPSTLKISLLHQNVMVVNNVKKAVHVMRYIWKGKNQFG